MKKAVALAVIIGTVGVLTTATAVTAWGGARALFGPARTASVEHTGGRGHAGLEQDGGEGQRGAGLGSGGRGASQTEQGPALGDSQGRGRPGLDHDEGAERNGGRGRSGGGGQGAGRDQAQSDHEDCDECGASQGAVGTDSLAARGSGRRDNPNAGTVEEHDIATISGTVLVSPDSGEDMVIVAAGEEIKVGTGPGWLAAQGFVLEEGDDITVVGFWEDAEFKATEITMGDETIVLRDESGRPMWAGQGQRKNARPQTETSGDVESGRGRGAGTGQGRN